LPKDFNKKVIECQQQQKNSRQKAGVKGAVAQWVLATLSLSTMGSQSASPN
jgi:hypothetical protein